MLTSIPMVYLVTGEKTDNWLPCSVCCLDILCQLAYHHHQRVTARKSADYVLLSSVHKTLVLESLKDFTLAEAPQNNPALTNFNLAQACPSCDLQSRKQPTEALGGNVNLVPQMGNAYIRTCWKMEFKS